MSIFEHQRFEIHNQSQHPYKHDVSEFSYSSNALPGVTNISSAMDWVINVLYPTPKASVANVAALPAVSNTIGDYRVVLDDGDGKSAGYRWEQREGDATAKWYKIYDMDFGAGSVLQQAASNAQELFVSKFGNNDLDSTGVALTGTNAGQHIYGGISASTNLTLHANSGDGVGSQTGYVQLADNLRPTADASWDLGTTALRFNNQYLAGVLRINGTAAINGGTELFTADVSSDGSGTAIIAAAGRVILSGNTAQTVPARSMSAEFRRTITTSTTDTASHFVLDILPTRYSISSGQTYTNNAGGGVAQLAIETPSIVGAGTLAITTMYSMKIANNTIASGTNKIGVCIGTISGATNNTTLLLGTTASAAGDWALYSQGTNKSYFGGPLRTGTSAIINGTVEQFSVLLNDTSAASQISVGASVYLEQSGNTANTGGGLYGLLVDARRSTTANTTDTTTNEVAAGFFRFRVAPSAATAYTSSGSRGCASLWVVEPQNAGGGTASFANAANLTIEQVTSNALATRKMAIRFMNFPAGGTNNAMIADNATFTGDWFINQNGTQPSAFGGPICTTTTSVASATTIAAMVCTSSFIYITGSTATTIQGITAGKDGQLIRIWSRQANITVANQNASASAANRIYTNTAADVALTAPCSATLIYSATDASWVLMSSLA
jgi:hypothetical protein